MTDNQKDVLASDRQTPTPASRSDPRADIKSPLKTALVWVKARSLIDWLAIATSIFNLVPLVELMFRVDSSVTLIVWPLCFTFVVTVMFCGLAVQAHVNHKTIVDAQNIFLRENLAQIDAIKADAAYLSALPKIVSAVDKLNEFHLTLKKGPYLDGLEVHSTSVLTHLSDFFSAAKGVPVRACIKAIGQDASKLTKITNDTPMDARRKALAEAMYAKEFARDFYTAHFKRYVIDPPGKVHPFADNSDFFHLYLHRDVPHWHCNDIQAKVHRQEYSSSRLKPESPGDKVEPLRYNSTMVWPIRRAGEDEQFLLGMLEFPGVTSKKATLGCDGCVGFLCVDSPASDIWRPDVDGPLGRLIADLFFTVYATAYRRLQHDLAQLRGQQP